MVAWLVGYHLLLRYFGPHRLMCMNVCVVNTIVILMMLRDFGLCEIILMTMCVSYFGVSCDF
jgi:hypothetical protein